MKHLGGQDNLSLHRLRSIAPLDEVGEQGRPQSASGLDDLDRLSLGINVV